MSHDPLRLRWIDLALIPLVPVFVVIGTAIHESSHALAGLSLGMRIEKFVVLPSARGWGYVVLGPPDLRLSSAGSIWLSVAPYVTWFAIFAFTWLAMQHRESRRRWTDAFLAFPMGLAAPIVDAVNNYAGYGHESSDTGHLLRMGFPLHAFFAVVLSLYLAGLLQLARQRRIRYSGKSRPRSLAVSIPVTCAVVVLGSAGLVERYDAQPIEPIRARIVATVVDVPHLLRLDGDDLATTLARASRPGATVSKDEFEGPTYWRTETAVGRLDVTAISGKVTTVCLTFSGPTPELRALMWTGLDPAKLRRTRNDAHTYDDAFDGVRAVYLAREHHGPRVTSIWISAR